MVSLLLAIIYLAFISLGLPDSLLGAAWPVMRSELGVPLSYAGVVSMIISGGTIISSLMSDKLTRKLGSGLVTAVSVALTAMALLGFSFSNSFLIICIWAVPYGLGAGAVDAALNNYVALHYSSRHMSWLHAFWGIGVSLSPYIMSFCLSNKYGWQAGYRSVAIIQIVITALIFISLPIWKNNTNSEETASADITIRQAIRIDGVAYVLIAFFAFCAFESTAGLWASSYMVEYRGIEAETAARFVSLFYLGITFGRILCGFISDKLGDMFMIRLGLCIVLFGTVMIMLPWGSNYIALGGLLVAGFGSAPVYPCIIHSTPTNFGKENSQALVGIQMASAYVGSTFMPPLFGLLAENISVALYPFWLALFASIVFVMIQIMNSKLKKHEIFPLK